jgi:signal transduction histidine kinase
MLVPELESAQQMPQETRFQELKRYVRFEARDAELLLAFRGLAAPEFPRIAREFFERIREHAEAHEVFVDEEQIQRVQRSLIAWLGRVCGGVYDEAYYEQTSEIGRVHVRIGLPQRYMLTAMALIRVALLRITDGELKEHAAATREAVSRILDLELAIMLEAYKDSLTGRLAHEIRNPLNGAQLHLALLERAIKKSASQQDMLDATQVVSQEIKRLAELVTEFLEFARPRPLEQMTGNTP